MHFEATDTFIGLYFEIRVSQNYRITYQKIGDTTQKYKRVLIK